MSNELEIKVKATGETKPLDDAKQKLDEVKGKGEGASGAFGKMGAEQGKAMQSAQNLGKALKSLASGDISGATQAAGKLAPAIAGIAGPVMAAVAAFKIWEKVLSDIAEAQKSAKFGELETLTNNAATAAESAAREFAKVLEQLGLIADKKDSVAAIASEVAKLNDETERAKINADRSRELAGTSDDIERARINAKHDARLAGVDERARSRNVETEQASIDRERERLQAENVALTDKIRADGRARGAATMRAQEAGEMADDYSPNWMSRNVFKWRGRMLADASQQFTDQQSAATSEAEAAVRRQQESAAQIRANKAALEALDNRERAVIPAMQANAAAQNDAGAAGRHLAGVDIDTRQRERDEAAAEKERERKRRADEAAAAEAEKAAELRRSYESAEGANNNARTRLDQARESWRSAPGADSGKELAAAEKAFDKSSAAFEKVVNAVEAFARRQETLANKLTADLNGV